MKRSFVIISAGACATAALLAWHHMSGASPGCECPGVPASAVARLWLPFAFGVAVSYGFAFLVFLVLIWRAPEIPAEDVYGIGVVDIDDHRSQG